MFRGTSSVVGLDIGSKSVKAVELSRVGGGGLQVTGFGQADVSSDDPVDCSRIIRDLFRKGGFKTRRVITSVSGKMVIVRYLSMVPMSDEELRTAIHLEAEKYVPFAMDECVLDCQRLGDGGAVDDTGQANVVLVAVKRGDLDHHLGVVKGAGITPNAIDVDAFALGNAFNLVQQCSDTIESRDSGMAFVDVGASKTSINILRGGVSVFTREVYFGGNDFTGSIGRSMSIGDADAEALKHSPGGEIDRVRDAVFPTIDDLGSEIQLSFDYFQNEHNRDVEKIFLSGGSSRFGFFRESFERILEKPTVIFNPFESLAVSDDIDQDLLSNGGPQLVVAVGLAARILKGSK